MNGFNINFKGIAIGNSGSDLVSMLNFSTFMYQVSLFDKEQTEIEKKY